MIPGELFAAEGEIEINKNRRKLKIKVENTGDRPIQVGSHYHFYEVNPALLFDRSQTKGFRLNVVSGTAVRFEPGQDREIELVELGGEKKVFGFRGDVMGNLDGDNS